MRSTHASAFMLAFTFAAAPVRAEGNSSVAEPAKPAATEAAKLDSTPAAPKPVAPVDDPAGAKQLFDEAVELARGGDYAAACTKLEQSFALHAGLGTQFHLAGCWSKVGRTASAYALFETVATKAHELGQADREEVARARMEALLPRLSRVRIDLTSPAPKTEVMRDGVIVPMSEWGKPVPLDRGPHEIVVRAEGKTPWSTKLDLTEPAVTVAVQVPALADSAKPVAPVAVAEKPAPPPPAPLPAEPDKGSNGSGRRTLAIVVGGVGVAALAAGIFKAVEYVDKNNEAKSICPSGTDCTSDEIARHGQAVDDARQARTWAYVGIGVGTAALVGGGVLFMTAPHGPSRQERALRLHFTPLADGRGTWGGVVRGSF